jgi:putative GTP pyrophosphokinase
LQVVAHIGIAYLPLEILVGFKDKEIGFISLLHGLNTADSEISTKKNVILIFEPDGNLNMRAYRDATEALRALFQIEKEEPGKDIVLVRADTSDEIRVAFRNYFSDARDFIRLIEQGCQKLSGKKVTRTQIGGARKRKRAAA